MTNVRKTHCIVTDEKGKDFAEKIISSFDRGNYRVDFILHDVKSTTKTDVYDTGVSILVLKPGLLEDIKAGAHPNLNALFQNPKYSIIICHSMDKNKAQVSKILSEKFKGFSSWTYINFCFHDDFTDLKLNILSLVEKSEGVEDVPMTPKLQNFKVWPGEDCKPNQSILLLFERPVDDDEAVNVKVVQEGGNLSLATQRLNSMSYSFNVGDMVAGMKTIEVFVNKSSYGRVKLNVESKMNELEHLLYDVTNATELLSQSLGCENMIDLDQTLRDLVIECNSPTLNNLFVSLDWGNFGETMSKSELPTLLHFGAKFGLREFCEQLITFPGARQALKMRNKNNLLPHEIARRNGFLFLASHLESEQDKKIQPKIAATSDISTSRYENTSSIGCLRGENDDVSYRHGHHRSVRSSESGISSQSTSTSSITHLSDRMTRMLDEAVSEIDDDDRTGMHPTFQITKL